MKKLLKIFGCVLAISAAFTAAAGDRIGVVDMERIFREYHKSRSTEEFINQRSNAVRAYMAQMKKELDKLRADARNTGTDSMNPALDDKSREQLRRRAAEAARKVKAKEAELELYLSEASRDVRDIENRKRAEIIADINAEVRRRAAARGFTVVLDKSGKTTNGQPAVILYPEKNDISTEVIRELNRTAGKNEKDLKK